MPTTYETYELGANGKPCVRLVNSKGRVVKCYSFRSTESRAEYIARMEAAAASTEVRRAKLKELKKVEREAIVNPYKVGDVFTESWGYDQTNVDAYEVVATTAKTVTLMAIGLTSDNGSSNVLPVPGHFINNWRTKGKEIKKVLQPYPVSPGNPDGCYVPSVCDHGWMRKWEGEPQYQTPYNMGH